MTLASLIDATFEEDSLTDHALRPPVISGRHIPLDRFAEAAGLMKSVHARLAAQWCAEVPQPDGNIPSVYAAYNLNADYLIIRSALSKDDPSFATITKKYPAAGRFERQIWSLFGVCPIGHPDLRVWIKHEDWPADAFPLRKTFDISTKMARSDNSYDWIQAQGEGVFEIPVGPVHAGIIEPGHFRFQAVGEDIINLEERLGYVHKGIEKTFETHDWQSAAKLSARVSGDTTVAHSLAYAIAVESAASCEVPLRAAYIRAILLERERIANHLGDIGAICNDAAFTFMLYQTAILREKILRTNKTVFGHRLTMDRVIPGGVCCDMTPGNALAIKKELSEISDEFEKLVNIYSDTASLEDRVNTTGVLSEELARELSTVGFVARASSVSTDARTSYKIAPYDKFPPRVQILNTGDVHARTIVRIQEVLESMRLINAFIDNLPNGAINTQCPAPPDGASGFSAIEGFRGEIIYWVRFANKGRINRCMVRDPSSVNWIALEHAIKGNIVPDFPLCNKSFNQSYSGNDL